MYKLGGRRQCWPPATAVCRAADTFRHRARQHDPRLRLPDANASGNAVSAALPGYLAQDPDDLLRHNSLLHSTQREMTVYWPPLFQLKLYLASAELPPQVRVWVNFC